MDTIESLKTNSEIPFVQIDEAGIIMSVNNKFESFFGWKSNDIIGKSILTIIPQNLHDAHNLGFSRFLTTETPTLLGKPLKLKAVKKDGTVFDAEHLIVGEKQGESWMFAATIKPLI